MESYADDWIDFQLPHNPRDHKNPMTDLSSSGSSEEGDEEVRDDSDDSGERDDADAFYCAAILYTRIESGKLSAAPF